MTDERRQLIANKIAAILADPGRTRRTVTAAVLAEDVLEHPPEGENVLFTALSTLRGGMVDTITINKALDVIFEWSDRMDARDPA